MESVIQYQSTLTVDSNIDRESGIIRNVCVATVGEAKGHDEYLDLTTLEQLQTCARAYRSGVKVLLNHAADVRNVVGTLKSFRTDGAKLLADLHLLKTSPHSEYVFEIAETMPDTFGLSVSFKREVQEVGGKNFSRCSELYSVDIVTEPAANPSGLFQTKTPTTEPVSESVDTTMETTDMKPEEIKALMDEALAPVNEQLSKFQSFMDEDAESKAALADEEAKKAEMAAEEEKKAELAAEEAKKTESYSRKDLDEVADAAIKRYANQLGGRPAAPAVKKPVEEKKNFEALVAEKAEELGNKPDAVTYCVKNHKEEHADFLNREGTL